jgi:membrane protease YdiL (CAAX protease family)
MPLDRFSDAPHWAPDWAVCLRPALQLVVFIAIWAAHLCSGTMFAESPIFDNVVGGAVLAGACALAATRRARGLSEPLPWDLPAEARAQIPGVACVLLVCFALSGQVGCLLEPIVELATRAGLPVSLGAERALEILLGHFAWVAMTLYTLSSQLSPFWPSQGGRWLSIRWRSLWLWWGVGGYFGSIALYNAAEALSLAFLPEVALEGATLVHRLTGPEAGGPIAIALGALAPCISAPPFEEVLYRAFVLASLSAYLPTALALPLQGVLFGAHHMQAKTILPLAALGSWWGLLYLKSRNLLVPMLVHVLWNSRAFLIALSLR